MSRGAIGKLTWEDCLICKNDKRGKCKMLEMFGDDIAIVDVELMEITCKEFSPALPEDK